MKKLLYLFCVLSSCSVAQASIFDDMWTVVKSAANAVADGIEQGANAVKNGVVSAANAVATVAVDGANVVAERFKDTQVTRAVDYGVRLAALETAKASATAILELSRQAAQGTLIAARESASGVLQGAEGFLAQVVNPSSNAILQTSADAANGVLEGVKQAGVGVLQGGQWVVNSTLGVIDLNRIHYDGNLQDFARGKLGNVEIEGKIVSPFTVRLTIDVNDILASIKPIVNQCVESLKKTFVDPFMPQIQQVKKNEKAVDAIVSKIEATQLPQENVQKMQQQVQAAQSQLATIKEEQQKMITALVGAEQLLSKLAMKTYDEIADSVKELARQGRMTPNLKLHIDEFLRRRQEQQQKLSKQQQVLAAF